MTRQTPAFVTFPDPRLNEAAQARLVDEGMLSIGALLLAAAQEVQAYGLAAAHIGHVAPVAVISLGEPSGRDYRLLYNPRITETQGQALPGPEGSVSMPGIEVEVIRPQNARIAFDDAEGRSAELDLTGFAARVAQHEIDQVNGVFFLSRISRLKRDVAIKRFSKLVRRMG